MNLSDDSDIGSGDEKKTDDESGIHFAGKRHRLESDEDAETTSSSSASGAKMAEPEVKKRKMNFGEKYLLKHGYQKGFGLGKYQNGIVEPMQASTQKGTRGIGYSNISLKKALAEYDPRLEVVQHDEEVIWLVNNDSIRLSEDLLESWVVRGPPLKMIDTQSLFCDADVLEGVLTSKNVFDNIAAKEMLNARRRSNPFESIGSSIFQNRAAMKMANLDAILDRMFTEPKDEKGNPVVGPDKLLYFADVCAGPGGFSEYVLYRKKWRAKGFGFTLKRENDFKLNDFCAGSPETFEPHYGKRGDGDIYYPENIECFKEHVLKSTNNQGVHFMMADGGIHIDENYNDQEIICKKLYLCQCLTALHIVRNGGHFVVKLFDLFTSFSVGLLYLMYKSFRKISIIKPNTSRPANSERYLVCKWKLPESNTIANHLFKINYDVPEFDKNSNWDVLELVPTEILTKDDLFYEYICSSNNKIGKNQRVSLLKIAAFTEDTNLKELRQQELRKICLEKWNIPDQARAKPKKCDPAAKCWEMLRTKIPSDRLVDEIKDIDSLKSLIFKEFSEYYYSFIPVEGEKNDNSLTFYLGLGRNNVHKLVNGKWKTCMEEKFCSFLSLPPDTLVYGELVKEYTGEGRSQRKTFAFHIIDALFLGEEDIRNLPFLKRLETCKLFASAVNKENFPVRIKHLEFNKDFPKFLKCVVPKSLKCNSSSVSCVCIDENTFYKIGGVLFFEDTKDPWKRHLSKKNNIFYLYNVLTKNSSYEQDIKEELYENCYHDFWSCFKSKKVWWWEKKDADSIVLEMRHL